MIYVPNLEEYACFYVRDSETLRAYKTMPEQGKNIEYRDYFVNSHYLYQDGIQQFNTYITIPICLDSSVLTKVYVYRNDFADIMIIFMLMLFFVIYFAIKPFKLLFLGKKRF